jgi:hypothetical protein
VVSEISTLGEGFINICVSPYWTLIVFGMSVENSTTPLLPFGNASQKTKLTFRGGVSAAFASRSPVAAGALALALARRPRRRFDPRVLPRRLMCALSAKATARRPSLINPEPRVPSSSLSVPT